MDRVKKFALALFAVLLLLTVVPVGAIASNLAVGDFVDMDETAWYSEGVQYSISNGYMIGTGSQKFEPYGNVTKAQAIQVLYNIDAQSSTPHTYEPTGSTFDDVNESKWYYRCAEWAKNIGIIDDSDTFFLGSAVLTRERLISLFARYHAAINGEHEVNRAYIYGYTDWKSVDTSLRDDVNWAVQYGMITGMSSTKLSPYSSTNRVQLAKMIYSFLNPEVPSLDDHIYSSKGIDITDVDGVLTGVERQAIDLVNKERAARGLAPFVWSPTLQRLAEIRAKEVGENYDNFISTFGFADKRVKEEPGMDHLMAVICHSRPDKSRFLKAFREEHPDMGNSELMEAVEDAWCKTYPRAAYSYDIEGENGIVAEFLPELADCMYFGENATKEGRGSFYAVDAWMNSPGHRSMVLTEDYVYIGMGYDDQSKGWSMITGPAELPYWEEQCLGEAITPYVD